MHLQNIRRISVIGAVALLAMLMVACLFLPRGVARMALSDLVGAR